MKLIITRHGETEGNVKRILADISDPLTSNGIKQAKAVSERLKSEHLDVIFSSPIIRAKETAKIIAKNHPITKFIVVDELKEMDLGSYLNKSFDKVDWDLMPEDVENKISLFERGKTIIERVLEEYPTGTILFVAHNAINKAMIRFIRKWHPEDRRSIPQGNTAISIFEISPKERREMLFNCTKHLNENED
ncbi:histidine phosphatase family protein [Candidatus Pacearchaeota archaeon]|nr:histidine phosphatase family protein [Candidatus Pacearchaeota archaeon]